MYYSKTLSIKLLRVAFEKISYLVQSWTHWLRAEYSQVYSTPTQDIGIPALRWYPKPQNTEPQVTFSALNCSHKSVNPALFFVALGKWDSDGVFEEGERWMQQRRRRRRGGDHRPHGQTATTTAAKGPHINDTCKISGPLQPTSGICCCLANPHFRGADIIYGWSPRPLVGGEDGEVESVMRCDWATYSGHAWSCQFVDIVYVKSKYFFLSLLKRVGRWSCIQGYQMLTYVARTGAAVNASKIAWRIKKFNVL